MAIAEAADTLVLRCELGWEEVREIMAASRLLTVMRRSWLAAGVMFAALLAESLVLLRLVVTRPAAYGAHHGLLLDELLAGASLCLLLTCWSALRAWRLSPGRQDPGDQERELLIASIDELTPEDRRHVAALVESLRKRTSPPPSDR